MIAYDIPYAFFFEKTTNQAVNLLEIGSSSDISSLKFWKAVLPKANVFADPDKAHEASKAGGGVDIIIAADDGDEDEIWADRFVKHFPLLRSGGWYVIEGYQPNSEITAKLFQTVPNIFQRRVGHRNYRT